MKTKPDTMPSGRRKGGRHTRRDAQDAAYGSDLAMFLGKIQARPPSSRPLKRIAIVGLNLLDREPAPLTLALAENLVRHKDVRGACWNGTFQRRSTAASTIISARVGSMRSRSESPHRRGENSAPLQRSAGLANTRHSGSHSRRSPGRVRVIGADYAQANNPAWLSQNHPPRIRISTISRFSQAAILHPFPSEK